jgi:hypothetical protein
MGQQAPSRAAARCPAQQPRRDGHVEHGLLPPVKRDQRRQPGLQGLRRWRVLRRDQGMLDRAAVAQPGQEPRHRRDPDPSPPPGLGTLLEERPPLSQRRRVATDRVRRPQVPMGIQPLLDRGHRPVVIVDHRPGARSNRGPDRQAMRHVVVPSRRRAPADNDATTTTIHIRHARYRQRRDELKTPLITPGTGKTHCETRRWSLKP